MPWLSVLKRSIKFNDSVESREAQRDRPSQNRVRLAYRIRVDANTGEVTLVPTDLDPE